MAIPPTLRLRAINQPSLNLVHDLLQTLQSQTATINLTTTHDPPDMVSDAP